LFQLLKRHNEVINAGDGNLVVIVRGETINYRDIQHKMSLLLEHNLNGREIENVINLARQLARPFKKLMDYSHLDG
jgi:hypothetical protein